MASSDHPPSPLPANTPLLLKAFQTCYTAKYNTALKKKRYRELRQFHLVTIVPSLKTAVQRHIT